MFGRRKRDINYDDFYRDDRDREIARMSPPRALPHLFLLAIFGTVTLGAVRATAGPNMFEAVLKELATPCGVIWILLFVAAYLSTLRRNALAALLTWASWLMLTLGGNSFVTTELVRSLEQPYLDTNLADIEPLDVVLVLGGGTSTDPAGSPQLTCGGDRIMTAVRLYHLNKSTRFVCAGTRWQGVIGNELDIHQEQARILTAAGVPPENIVEIKAGTNTATEIEAFRDWLDKNPTDRTGIVTSAWHMQRVEKIAIQNGIDFVPIPCHFLTRRFKPDPNLLVPGIRNLATVKLAWKEYLAMWMMQLSAA